MTVKQKGAQIARDIGWLEGFGAALWALCEAQAKEVVTPETCALYDNVVARLRETVTGVSLPNGKEDGNGKPQVLR